MICTHTCINLYEQATQICYICLCMSSCLSTVQTSGKYKNQYTVDSVDLTGYIRHKKPKQSALIIETAEETMQPLNVFFQKFRYAAVPMLHHGVLHAIAALHAGQLCQNSCCPPDSTRSLDYMSFPLVKP